MSTPEQHGRVRPAAARRRIAAAVAALCTAAFANSGAVAFEFDTGNPDWTVRWDNTLRFNYATRVESRDSKIGNSADRRRRHLQLRQGRRGRQAHRPAVRARRRLQEALRRARQRRRPGTTAPTTTPAARNPNPPLSNIPSYIGNQYSPYIKRFYHGGSGEIMDAFVFGRLRPRRRAGARSSSAATRSTGASRCFLGGNLHSVAYAQNPLDLQKGFATPGTEAKELFRPLNQLSAQAQVTDTLSRRRRSTCSSGSRSATPKAAPTSARSTSPSTAPTASSSRRASASRARGDPSEPTQRGEWGLSARWSPEWLDGTMGFYYRNFADKLPQTFSRTVAPQRQPLQPDLRRQHRPVRRQPRQEHRRRQRRRRVLVPPQHAAQQPGAGHRRRACPREGETKGPRGDTCHALVNVLGVDREDAAVRRAPPGPPS